MKGILKLLTTKARFCNFTTAVNGHPLSRYIHPVELKMLGTICPRKVKEMIYAKWAALTRIGAL